MKVKRIIKEFLPPIIITIVKRLCTPSRREWEYVAQGWTAEATKEVRGWNAPNVARTYARKWEDFRKRLQSPQPLGVPPDSLNDEFDLAFHNTVMSFAHALATAGFGRNQLAVLDWGGAFGHYSLIARALFPSLQLDYSCKDLPAMVEMSKPLLLDVHFYAEDSCFEQQYDFVLASTSLQYSKNWREVAEKLVHCANSFVFVTGLPVITTAASFVFVQRAYAFGYDTEYLAWCFNREEFLTAMNSFGAELVREYILGYRPHIHNAPEQCEYRGYMFRVSKSQ